MTEQRNRLGQETSPYLLQHAENPVAWQPWGDEALDRARAEDRPILLSIGYSSCHWCHVMAHESFEDEETARLMNQYFVNIKVDREERPDLDKIYQLALQVLTRQSGGWPLTMFLDPHTHLPFFGGTYFPRRARYQLPGFVDLVRRIASVYETQRDALREQGQKLSNVFDELTLRGQGQALPGKEMLATAHDALAQQYDHRYGGFGDAPKFPMPTTVERVLRHWAFTERRGERDAQGLDMAMITLTQIARGGIRDHVGGGFCRYSTDSRWMIPHFEKMLYDNGPLLALYADVLGVTPDDLFSGAVHQSANWVMREMQSTEGGYYAAMDADSEGEEGKFYLWRRNEVRKLLSDDEYLVVETLYGLDKPANFEGRWNLHRYDSWRSVVARLGLQRDIADALLQSAREKLFHAREQRIRPGRDDKILCSWNGLMIHGMARASSRLNEPRWLESAHRALDFIRDNLWDGERLRSSWTRGRAGHAGYLDDYANLLAGLLASLEAGWRDEDIRLAVALADAVIEHFMDPQDGGFHFTAHDQETLIYRPKPVLDEAMPAGNGMVARCLYRLGHLMANERYLQVASETLRWAGESITRAPAAHCTLLSALEDELYPPEIVVIRGEQAEIA
ncbi:MAG: thioredoxin domain-containing protein, partial [Pseudomonadales bacterium]